MFRLLGGCGVCVGGGGGGDPPPPTPTYSHTPFAPSDLRPGV